MPKKTKTADSHIRITQVRSARAFAISARLAHIDGASIVVGESAPTPATIRGLSVTLLSPLLSATGSPMDPRVRMGVSHPEAPADSPSDATSDPPTEPTEEPPNE